MKRSDIVAIIPARSGSKRLPRKNLLPLAGKPLLAHTVEHALAAKCVTEVVVSTDDREIAAVATGLGASVVERPADLASDSATSESVLIHALDWRRNKGLNDPALVVFLQCTSPIRSNDDIDRAVKALEEQKADSIFSACRESPFIWRGGAEGLTSFTYDYRARKRTQEWPPYFRENGSIYIFRPHILRECANRLGGKVGVYEMSAWSSFDIDCEEDLHLVRMIIEDRFVRTTGQSG
jgi:N-acylneuraminate cytidylyltransferase